MELMSEPSYKIELIKRVEGWDLFVGDIFEQEEDYFVLIKSGQPIPGRYNISIPFWMYRQHVTHFENI